jgi:Ras-related protein Rab-18
MIYDNKLDLEESRQISTEEGAKFVEENDAIYLETSAKTYQGIECLFQWG